MEACLLVRAGGRQFGLRVEQVREVIDGFEVAPAPCIHASVRGIARIRNASVPLVHLASLMTNSAAPAEMRDTAVLARCQGSFVAFEIDDADSVASDEATAAPDTWRPPWVCGVMKTGGSRVPVIDLDVLGERLVAAGEVGGR